MECTITFIIGLKHAHIYIYINIQTHKWIKQYYTYMTACYDNDNTIKGPDNPTCQLPPIMSNKCCSGTGKEGKTKEVVKDREVKTVVWDKVVCERWCVTKKDGVRQRWYACMHVCMHACMHVCMYA